MFNFYKSGILSNHQSIIFFKLFLILINVDCLQLAAVSYNIIVIHACVLRSCRKCSATCAGNMFSSKILLIPRIVSTSSCSTFSLVCHKKSVLAVNSICRSNTCNNTIITMIGSNSFRCQGISGKLQMFVTITECH